MRSQEEPFHEVFLRKAVSAMNLDGRSKEKLFPELSDSSCGRRGDDPQILSPLLSSDFPTMRKVGMEVKAIAPF